MIYFGRIGEKLIIFYLATTPKPVLLPEGKHRGGTNRREIIVQTFPNTFIYSFILDTRKTEKLYYEADIIQSEETQRQRRF